METARAAPAVARAVEIVQTAPASSVRGNDSSCHHDSYNNSCSSSSSGGGSTSTRTTHNSTGSSSRSGSSSGSNIGNNSFSSIGSNDKSDISEHGWSDPGLEERFYANYGPDDETIVQMVQRTYKGLCKRIYDPERKLYQPGILEFDGFQYCEFELPLSFPKHLIKGTVLGKVPAKECSLNAVYWAPTSSCDETRRSSSSSSTSSRHSGPSVCIIYLHTNTRNLTDAMEILPLCARTGYGLLALDLPGHGKSKLSYIAPAVMLEAINAAIERVMIEYNVSEFILWCRGMATAAGIEYCSVAAKTSTSIFSFEKETLLNSEFSRRCKGRVKVLVLDTPFTSLKDVVDDAIQRLRDQRYFIPDVAVSLGASFVRSTLIAATGSDPYDINPAAFVQAATVPCFLLVATNDDYIAPKHSDWIASQWRGPRQLAKFDGTHFSVRSLEHLAVAQEFIEAFLLVSVAKNASLELSGRKKTESCSNLALSVFSGNPSISSSDPAILTAVSKSISWDDMSAACTPLSIANCKQLIALKTSPAPQNLTVAAPSVRISPTAARDIYRLSPSLIAPLTILEMSAKEVDVEDVDIEDYEYEQTDAVAAVVAGEGDESERTNRTLFKS
jgi:pimeloyl-ACP methyl ester carboxylesterase